MATAAAAPTTAPPLIRVIPRLAPRELHQAVWKACSEKRWYYGHQSVTENAGIPFWKMDLERSEAVKELWGHAKPICEKLSGGARLRPVRTYANGHTYGQGGQPH